MRRSIQTLIDNPELRARMGEASRLRARQAFSWKEVIRRYEELWRELGDMARAAADSRPQVLTESVHGIFGHYAAEQLEPSTRLTRTAAGERLLTRSEFIPLFGQPSAVEPEHVVTLLQAVSAPGGTPSTLAALEQDTRASWGPGRTHFLRHVLWLLKFGLLQRVQGPVPS